MKAKDWRNNLASDIKSLLPFSEDTHNNPQDTTYNDEIMILA